MVRLQQHWSASLCFSVFGHFLDLLPGRLKHQPPVGGTPSLLSLDLVLFIQTPNHHIALPAPVIVPMSVEATPTLLVATAPQRHVHHALQLLKEDKVVGPLSPPAHTDLGLSRSVEPTCPHAKYAMQTRWLA